MRAVYSVLTVGILACKADERRSTLVTPPPPTAPMSVSEPPPAPIESVRVPDGKEPIDGGIDIRVYSARDFLAAWEKTEPAALARNFPPSPPFYRISGGLITVETPVLRDSQGNPDPARKASSDAFVQAGDQKRVALRFDPDSPDVPTVKRLKPGVKLTATCRFYGLAEMGIVTFDNCKL